MLPPVEPSVFERNPNFEVLYKDLCIRKLNADGSTRDTKKQRMHAEIRQDLTTHRTNIHTTQILTTTLSNLPSLAPTLPPDLHTPIALVTALLTAKIHSKDRPILTPDIQVFLSNADIIAAALSPHLESTASLLCTLASPGSPPPVPALPSTAAELRTSATQTLPSTLAIANSHLATSTRDVLTAHLALLHTAILTLERTQHGTLSRATAAHAENAQARAQLLGVKAKLHITGNPPPGEFVKALKGWRGEIATTERALKDREGIARRALELYERAGERGMRDLAGRKEVLGREIERVREEVGGLEKEGMGR